MKYYGLTKYDEHKFKKGQQQRVLKEYRIDEFTTVKKLENGAEYVVEDYQKALKGSSLSLPQKVERLLHPGGRQDTRLTLTPVRSKARQKNKKPNGLLDKYGNLIN